MLKKLLPAVLGALLVASPVIAVTTAAAAPQAASSSGAMKSSTHHKTSQAQEVFASRDEEAFQEEGRAEELRALAVEKAPPGAGLFFCSGHLSNAQSEPRCAL